MHAVIIIFLLNWIWRKSPNLLNFLIKLCCPLSPLPFTFTQLLSRTVCLRIALLIVVDFCFVSTLLIDERELLLRFSVSCKRLSVTESSSMLGLSVSWRQYTCFWICLQLQLIKHFFHTFYFLSDCYQRSKKSFVSMIIYFALKIIFWIK